MVTYLADQRYPEAETITLIQDNLAAHKVAALYEIHEPEKARNIIKKLNIVFTPKHTSWLNIAEIELSMFKRVGLKTRMESKEALIQCVKNYENMKNNEVKKINWQFTTKDVRVKLKYLYPKI